MNIPKVITASTLGPQARPRAEATAVRHPAAFSVRMGRPPPCRVADSGPRGGAVQILAPAGHGTPGNTLPVPRTWPRAPVS
ncbi:hypothetical protein GCM10010295_25490 [Streptomyces intermedius]